MTISAKSSIEAEKFDKDFDENKDVSALLDSDYLVVNRKVKRVNVDFTLTTLHQLDREAHRIGVARTALIKMLISQYLDSKHFN